jgi:hypothetical protein
MHIVSLHPFARLKLSLRRDIAVLDYYKDQKTLFASTYDGELVKLQDDLTFKYIGPSLAGSVHDISPDQRRAAVFINGRLYSIILE